MLLDRAAPILSKTKVISPQVFENPTVFSFEPFGYFTQPSDHIEFAVVWM